MLATRLILTAAAGVVAVGGMAAAAADLMPGFKRSPFWGEQLKDLQTAEGIKVHINAPEKMRPDVPTRVVFYSTPNGNSIAQTLGVQMKQDLDWHYDIQHIAAQTRRLREVSPDVNIVLVCIEAEGKSWPGWRAKHEDNAALIRAMVEDTIKGMPGKSVSVTLTGHSGGGSMIFGFINAFEQIPAWVDRIAWLDANYAYSDESKHGDKLIAWLKGDSRRNLTVVAYDDRNITFDGKLVNGPAAGTYRATERMRARFEKDMKLEHAAKGDLDYYTAMDGRITFIVHRNPANKILHTVLVGEMNGFLEAMTLNTPEHGKWGDFGTPRAYTKWIQPAADAAPPAQNPSPAPYDKSQVPVDVSKLGGHASPAGTAGTVIMKSVAAMSRSERESQLLREIVGGNAPAFMGKFVTVRVSGVDAKGKAHTASYEVSPDYVCVGTDKDFVRVPLTPMVAQPLADSLKCSLTTRKMCDDIYKQAEVKLEPRPMTNDRESVETFVRQNAIIEEQRKGKPLGALVAGVKKDVVITNLLQEREHRVAIYGWHQLDGKPIQPLTTVHVDWYVDYSHGIRLVKRQMIVDGEQRDLWDVLKDPDLCFLVSDEGPIAVAHY